MIASFAAQKVTRLRGKTTEDDYGNPDIDWDDPDTKSIDPVTVGPVSGSETFDEQGQKLVSRWMLHAESGADITDDDRIEHNGIQYDIDGAVQVYRSPTGKLDHLEIMLKRVN